MSCLIDTLRELDQRLSKAADAVRRLFGPNASRDFFRGISLTPADVDCALERTPIVPLFGAVGAEGPLVSTPAAERSGLADVQRAYGLSALETDVLLLALAPELDLRYERLYAFVQDDVAKKRPSVELALNLLTSSVEHKIAALSCFHGEAPLLRHGLITLSGADSGASRLGNGIVLDGVVLRYLLASDKLDERIARYARGLPPASRRAAPQPSESRSISYWRGHSSDETLQRARAGAAGASLLVLDVAAALAAGEWDPAVQVSLRSTRLSGQALLLQHADALLASEQEHRLRRLYQKLGEHRGSVQLSGTAPWHATPAAELTVVELCVSPPEPARRAEIWVEELSTHPAVSSSALALAAAFRLDRAQVAHAARAGAHRAHARGDAQPSLDDLRQAARSQLAGALGGLAQRFDVNADLSDLVLPAEALLQLREMALRVSKRQQVLGTWGFGPKRSYGNGTALLFAGPSGTGKTLAAGALAKELGLEAYRIDLSSILSKYIGETQKNLERVFAAAEETDCVLVFDEADACFGKRSEVKDAHDRYANQELSYLLQRVEQFSGLAILTTNLPGSIDDAFRRRLAATVYFPLPDEAARRTLWQRAWPTEAPLAADVNCAALASRFEISGGTIAQAALSAGYLAADSEEVITLAHVLRALEREHAALGLPMPQIEPRTVHA